MLVSSYQLLFQQEHFSQSKILGELSLALSVVKIKNPLNLDFRDAQVGNDISDNQLIFTNPDASAEISFHEGGKLQIGENSLIRVRAEGKGLDIERGIIRAKLDGDRPFLLEMNGNEYELTGKNTEIQINLKGDKGEIGVISGNLTVEKDGAREIINPDSLIALDGDKMKKRDVAYKLISPESRKVFFYVGQETPITFNWEPADEATLLLSNSADMAGVRKIKANPGIPQDLGPGTYYWKVESDKGLSLTNTFRVQRESTPVVIRPLSGSEVKFIAREDQDSELVLQWQGDFRTRYMLEWETKGETHSSVHRGGSAILKIAESGILNWRIRLEDEKRPLALWSPWQEIKVKRIHAPVIPTNLSPDGIEYQTYTDPNEEIELKWTSEHPVEIELITPKGHKELKSSNVKSHFAQAVEIGVYRWRIRANDGFERTSDWTEWKTFEITDMKDDATPGVQRVQLKKPDQLVKFAWENQGEETTFELASDPAFKEVVIKRDLKSGSTETVMPKTGTYFWRSRQTRTDGTINLSRPIKVIIEQAPAPGKPEKLPDVEVPIEWKVIEKKTTWNLLDFFISRAHADEVKGVVKIEIPASEDAKTVMVRVYRDQEMQNLILEKIITGITFEWEGANPGIYYYQYAIVDHWGRQSPFSDPAILTVTGKEMRAAEKPKLGYPIRAAKIETKNLTFKWSESDEAVGYRLQVSDSENFKNFIVDAETKDNSYDLETLPTKPGLYYWRVKALNEFKQETISNTGRFTILPPLEKIVIADQLATKKVWKRRASIAWTPSKDEYSFKDGVHTGNISGQAIMGIEIKATVFFEDWIVSGEILRQSGSVFEGEGYLFQRLFVDGVRNYNLPSGTRIGAGLGFGQTTGQEYTIAHSTVKSTTSADTSYGPIFRSFHPINKDWEAQTKVLYFLGGIKQVEFSGEMLRAWKESYQILGGLSYARREYEVGSGEQSSIRFSVGIVKEF